MEPDVKKSSQYNFDVYACPNCDNAITASVYPFARKDIPCPQCEQRQVGEYELRKGKERER